MSPNASLSEWFASPQGGYVLAREQECIDAVVADVFGYNALQVGLPTYDLLRANRITHHLACDRDGAAGVLAEPSELPFSTASLDLVVLPHVLEFARQPHHILREIERVLVPEGSIVIVGFNPFSLFGARRLCSRGRGQLPWRGHYFSVPRLRDWLTLLGFEIEDTRFGCHAPPAHSAKWQERWQFMERAGKRWWPVCGGFFVIHAIKRVQGMRLITPKWRSKAANAKSLAPIARGRPVAHKHRT
ncbi:MAG: class I SAM-dependent methyltransferase [Pseudazoarcus pumilus]|nr:class I SAM-dependent methyltransferase [Pseudazoarcus pumilus]